MITKKVTTKRKNVFFRVSPTMFKLIRQQEKAYKSRSEFFTALVRKEAAHKAEHNKVMNTAL